MLPRPADEMLRRAPSPPGGPGVPQPPSRPHLSVADLSVTYRSGDGSTLRALQDLSFTLNRGEVLGVFGPSGCGKSTLAASLLALLPPARAVSTGAVYFEDRNLLTENSRNLRDIRGNRISIVFQEPAHALHPLIRAADQVAEVLAAHGQLTKQQARTRAIEVLESVFPKDASCIARRYPHELSGGQRQCVLIAQAVACGPGVLIADEPTASLDLAARSEIVRLLCSLRERLNFSLILVSHDASLLGALADRVLALAEGKSIHIGPAASVLQELARSNFRTPSDWRQAARNTPLRPSGIQMRAPGSQPRPLPEAKRPSHFPQAAVVLEAQNLVKSFWAGSFGSKTRLTAVNGASVSLRAKTITAIVGPCGSGKSTLALCLTTLERPDSGNLWFAGENLATLQERRLRLLRPSLQLVFQDPLRSLNPKLTVREILLEPFRIQRAKLGANQLRILSELLDPVGLSTCLLARQASELSGGQRQRLAIARALAVSPKVLVLDEALSALDRMAQQQMAGLIRERQRSSDLSCVLITHDQVLAECFADEIALMERGKIVGPQPPRIATLGEAASLPMNTGSGDRCTLEAL